MNFGKKPNPIISTMGCTFCRFQSLVVKESTLVELVKEVDEIYEIEDMDKIDEVEDVKEAKQLKKSRKDRTGQSV